MDKFNLRNKFPLCPISNMQQECPVYNACLKCFLKSPTNFLKTLALQRKSPAINSFPGAKEVFVKWKINCNNLFYVTIEKYGALFFKFWYAFMRFLYLFISHVYTFIQNSVSRLGLSALSRGTQTCDSQKQETEPETLQDKTYVIRKIHKDEEITFSLGSSLYNLEVCKSQILFSSPLCK